MTSCVVTGRRRTQIVDLISTQRRVTTVQGERSYSALSLLETSLHHGMNENRLNGLAEMCVYSTDIEQVGENSSFSIIFISINHIIL